MGRYAFPNVSGMDAVKNLTGSYRRNDHYDLALPCSGSQTSTATVESFSNKNEY